MFDVTTIERDGLRLFRFLTERGTVWAIVQPTGPNRGRMDVSEEKAALSARLEPDELSFQTRRLMRKASNHFGTLLMLKMMRHVFAACPEISAWEVDRITGANPSPVHRLVRV